jgi:hypothetical protein
MNNEFHVSIPHDTFHQKRLNLDEIILHYPDGGEIRLSDFLLELRKLIERNK